MKLCKDCTHWKGGNNCGNGAIRFGYEPIAGAKVHYYKSCKVKNRDKYCTDFTPVSTITAIIRYILSPIRG